MNTNYLNIVLPIEDWIEDERWLKIQGHECYAISSAGRVYSFKRNRLLKGSIVPNGHVSVGLMGDDGKKRNYYLSRLVLSHFSDYTPLPNECVYHVDGDVTNDSIHNLTYADKSLILKGSHRTRKVVCEETGEVYDSVMDASETTGTNYYSIYNCCNGRQKTAGKLHWHYEDPIFD